MEILRSKTPQMVRKEIYIFLLAYNLLRTNGTKKSSEAYRIRTTVFNASASAVMEWVRRSPMER